MCTDLWNTVLGSLRPKRRNSRETAENGVNSPGIRKNWGSPHAGEVTSHTHTVTVSSWGTPTPHSTQSATLSSKVLMKQPELKGGNWPPYQVSKFCRQTSIGGLFHVHHFCVCAQNVEFSEPRQKGAETLKRFETIKQTKMTVKYSTKYSTYPFTVFLSFTSLQKKHIYKKSYICI